VKIIQRRWRECRGRAFARRVKQTVPELFWGMKERRKDSIYREFKGDYISSKSSRIFKNIKTKHKEGRVYFADKIVQLNPKGKPAKRVVIVTEKAIYIIGGLIGKKVILRININEIASIELSTLQDGVFVIRSKDGNDDIFESDKKTELIGAIYELSAELSRESGSSSGDTFVSGTFQVNFASSGNLSTKNKKATRALEWKKEDSLGEKVNIQAKGSTTVVSTGPGLDKSAGPKKRAKPQKSDRSRQINRNATGDKRIAVICQVKAKSDYEARNARELSFKAGDIIDVTKKSASGVWQGQLKGKRGTFPVTYVDQA